MKDFNKTLQIITLAQELNKVIEYLNVLPVYYDLYDSCQKFIENQELVIHKNDFEVLAESHIRNYKIKTKLASLCKEMTKLHKIPKSDSLMNSRKISL